MQIHCENCGAVIPGANINIQEKLAVCPQCGSVFSFVDHLNRPTPRRKTKPPESLRVTETNTALEIRFRWRQILKAEEHFFTFLMAVGAVLLTRLAYAMYDGLDTILEGAVGVGAVLGALVCLYLVLVLLVNKVNITIDNRVIRTRHTPLPWTNKTVNRADVVGVECNVTSYSDENPEDEFVDYNVQLVRHDGHKTTLVGIRRELAFYIAQVIEDYLHGEEIQPYTAADQTDEADQPGLLQQADEDETADGTRSTRS